MVIQSSWLLILMISYNSPTLNYTMVQGGPLKGVLRTRIVGHKLSKYHISFANCSFFNKSPKCPPLFVSFYQNGEICWNIQCLRRASMSNDYMIINKNYSAQERLFSSPSYLICDIWWIWNTHIFSHTELKSIAL